MLNTASAIGMNATNSFNNNSSSNSSIGLTLDHQQLLQISQLMNEMQNNTSTSNNSNMNQTDHFGQQQHECVALGDVNSLSNLMEIVVTSPSSARALSSSAQGAMISSTNNTNDQNVHRSATNSQQNLNSSQNSIYYSNSLILSPNSLNKYDTQTLQYGTNAPQQAVVNSQQIFTIAQPQQHQAHIIDANNIQQQQVHTIMLNGQPALFIPASSAMSSNLLSQMLMNQTTSQTTSNNSTATTSSKHESISSETNSNDLFRFESSNNPNNKLNNKTNIINDDPQMIVNQVSTQHHQQHHQSLINLSQLGLSAAIPLDQNQLTASNGNSQSTPTLSNQQCTTTLANGMTIIQIPMTVNANNDGTLNSNVNIVQAQQMQQPQIVCKLENLDTSSILNGGNQVLCIQPDGNITFQTIQSFNTQQTHTPAIQLNNPIQIQQQENMMPDFDTALNSVPKSKRTSKYSFYEKFFKVLPII